MSDAAPPPPQPQPEPGGATPAGSSGQPMPGGQPPPPPDQSVSGGQPLSSDPAESGGQPPPADPSTWSGQPAPGTPSTWSGEPPREGQPVQSGSPNISMSGDQVKRAVQSAHTYDLGIMAAGLLAFLFSLFPFYSYGLNLGGLTGGISGLEQSTSVTAWHGFFGWFGVLLALAGAVVVALSVFGMRLGIPTRLAALGAFAAATLCLLLALFVIPGKADCQGISACEGAVSYGHSFGYWATLLVVIGGLVLCVLRREARA